MKKSETVFCKIKFTTEFTQMMKAWNWGVSLVIIQEIQCTGRIQVVHEIHGMVCLLLVSKCDRCSMFWLLRITLFEFLFLILLLPDVKRLKCLHASSDNKTWKCLSLLFLTCMCIRLALIAVKLQDSQLLFVQLWIWFVMQCNSSGNKHCTYAKYVYFSDMIFTVKV